MMALLLSVVDIQNRNFCDTNILALIVDNILFQAPNWLQPEN